MSTVIPIKGARVPPKTQQSRMDTIIVTPDMVRQWQTPPFQRPLRINDKVRRVADEIKNNEVIDGVLTLGSIGADSSLYIVDGQHRIEAFKISEMSEALADVRVCKFATMADMADEFVNLNSSLVKMRPDDILRGLENSLPSLKAIRRSCEFVGYDFIRRNTQGPIVSMSAVIRCWNASLAETPASAGGASAAAMAQSLEQSSAQNLIAFLATAHSAWGRDPEYYRLWSNLNLAVCMWLWNRLVIDRDRRGSKRYALLDIHQFKRCLMSVSADINYLEWLVGRNLGDRDRSPCYTRLKSIFVRRLMDDGNNKKRPALPSPAWASK